MKNCKNCGASAPQSSSQHSFTCEYCGSKNVDEEYFKEVAKTSNLGKSNRTAQLGLNAYVSEDYKAAEVHLEASIQESDQVQEVWIYLALCKSATLSASNFDRNFKAISVALNRAVAIDSDSEVLLWGRIAIFDSLLVKMSKVAHYYFDTAEKTYIALGKDKDAAKSAINDLVKGVERIHALTSHRYLDSALYAEILIEGVAHCLLFERRGADAKQLIEARLRLQEELLLIIDNHQDVVTRVLDGRGSNDKYVVKLLSTLRPDQIALKEFEKKSTGFWGRLFS